MRIGRSCGIFVLTLFLVGSGCASGGGGSPRGGSGSGGADGGDLDGSAGQAGTGGSSGTGASGGSGGTGGDDSDGGWLDDVCIMHDCDDDAECKGCPSGRNVCDESSHRCVKCVPGEPPTACAAGEECSQYGTCIPEGMTCETDSVGEPTVSCSSDADCYACDTMHQVCNTTTSKCVACNDTNMYACDQQASCKAGQCLDKCPSPCSMDSDCENCGTMVNPGHACNETTRHCGECSATTPCPGGSVCGPQGMCIAVCGDPTKAKGACLSDDDCTGCEGDLIACQVPINGGDGKCGLPAAGCSDIGSFAVLPAPWSQVTNLCSDDADCAGVGIDLNVGKILRDLSGLDQINDAVMEYGMNACASVSVGIMGESYSCGVCVPCREDADCDPIKFDPLIDQAFGPVGGLVANVLIKMAFGDAPHELNMYCEPVLGDFGVCAPCIDFLHECAVSSTSGEGCTTDWECAAGEHCKDGKCTEYAGVDCFGGDPCPSGQICSWNGGGYCCRAPFVGAPEDTCFSDAECVPDVCAQSRADCSSSSDPCFYCAPPVANCE